MTREYSRKIGIPCSMLQICLAIATLIYGIVEYDLIIGYHEYTFYGLGFWIPAFAIWVASHTLCGAVGLWAAIKNQHRGVITGLTVFSTVTAVLSSFCQLAYGVFMYTQVDKQPYFPEKHLYFNVSYVLSALGFGLLFVTISCGALGCAFLCCQTTSVTEVEELDKGQKTDRRRSGSMEPDKRHSSGSVEPEKRQRERSMELVDVEEPKIRGLMGRNKVAPATEEALNDF